MFDNCTIEFDNEENDQNDVVMREDELRALVAADFDKLGYEVNPKDGIKLNMNMRHPGSLLTSRSGYGDLILSRTDIPVFRGCQVEYQEKELDVTGEANEDDIAFAHAVEQLGTDEGRSL